MSSSAPDHSETGSEAARRACGGEDGDSASADSKLDSSAPHAQAATDSEGGASFRPDLESTPHATRALGDIRKMMASCIHVVTTAGGTTDDSRVRALAALEYLGLGLASVFASPGFMAYVRAQASRRARIRVFAVEHESLLDLLAEDNDMSLLGVCALLLKRLNLRTLFAGLYGAENGRPLPKSFSCAKLLHWGLAMAVILRRYYERLAEHNSDADTAKSMQDRAVAEAVAAMGSRGTANSKPGKDRNCCIFIYISRALPFCDLGICR